jgi:hypothetical protein
MGAIAPNREPIRGRDAIVEFLRGMRDVAGEINVDSIEHLRATASGKLANLVAKFTIIRSDRIRMIHEGLYERQPDGSVLYAVDQFDF